MVTTLLAFLIQMPALPVPVITAQTPPPAFDAAPRDERLRGFVRPSRQVELGASLEDILMVVEVEESQRVEAGQVLARLDDRLQQVVVEAAQVRAASRAEVNRAVLEHEDAVVDLERTQAAFDQGAASDQELRRARI
ncbi:MAG: hypothetical protein ACYTGC_00160, partial [Planctomycetota bacterium]